MLINLLLLLGILCVVALITWALVKAPWFPVAFNIDALQHLSTVVLAGWLIYWGYLLTTQPGEHTYAWQAYIALVSVLQARLIKRAPAVAPGNPS